MALSTMRSSRKERPQQAAAADRIKVWTRERFRLPNDAAILVSEVACGLPGCPPLETVIAFWTGKDTRHHFKVFKPMADVIEDDLPPSWMKNALIAEEGTGLECC
jgi:nitrate reductase delta subunit